MVPYLDEDEVPIINSFVRIFYGALHRSFWAMAIGWVIFACTTGYGGNESIAFLFQTAPIIKTVKTLFE